MYEAFYQLSADPFRLSPDPGFCFQHRTYRKAMAYMLHALHRAEGFIMITGRPGTGKTTLINDLIQTLKPDQAVVAKIVSTQLTAEDLLNLVAYAFNLDPGGGGKAKVLVQVKRFLEQQYQHGRRPLLIVDEAQDMGEEALEELRLLTNLLVGNHQLLQVFLIGQEQLRDTVNTPSLEQLNQRLIAATLLEPLDADDTRAYMKHRLRCVNWTGDPLLSTETYAMIQRYSQGIPRRINQICSRLFLHGSVEEKHRLGLADLKIVVAELQQELLLPMDKEDSNEAVSWPAEQHEETYEEESYQEEEPQTSPPAADQISPPAAERVAPATVTLPEIERAEQKPPMRTVDTAPRMPARAADTTRRMSARKPVSAARPRPRAGNNYASFHRRKPRWQPKHLAFLTALGRHASKAAALLRDRIGAMNRTALWGGAVSVLVLITALLVANFRTGDSDQPVGEQETLALNQAVTEPVVSPAKPDNEVPSVQPEVETPAAGESAQTHIPSSAGSQAGRGKERFAALERDLNTSAPATAELATDEAVTHAATDISHEEIVEQSQPSEDAPAAAQDPAPVLALSQGSQTDTDETDEQSQASHDEPVATKEAAPVIAMSHDSQTQLAAEPVPVKKVVVAPPVSKEEKIAELLDHGRRTLKRNQLLFPENNSAYHYFQRVLKLDPGNTDALHGIEQITARYARLATEAFENNDKDKAERYIARGFRVSPNDEGLRALRERMNAPAVKVASEQPPPVVPAPEPEPKPESKGLFKRFKAIFAKQPNEKIDNQGQTDE